MTFIKTKSGKRRKLTDSLSDAHQIQFAEKLKRGEFKEVGVTEIFNVQQEDRFTFSKLAVVVECETSVDDTTLWHRGWGFVYWKMAECKDGYVLEHSGERLPCILSNGSAAVDLDVMNYARSSFILYSPDDWERVVNWWKLTTTDAD